MNIVNRLRFDAARCEATFSKGVASNIEDGIATIERLRAALQNLVNNVLDYEKVNNLSPNPGRKYCWDTVEQAVTVLDQTK